MHGGRRRRRCGPRHHRHEHVRPLGENNHSRCLRAALYYADIEGSDSVVIRATATGRVTGTYVYASGSIGAVTAAHDDRAFYFVEDALSTATVKTFRITASGKITGLHSVRGGTISTHGGLVDSIAVSPDGSRVAAGEFFDPDPAAAARSPT
jgi:hypothetical protein